MALMGAGIEAETQDLVPSTQIVVFSKILQ